MIPWWARLENLKYRSQTSLTGCRARLKHFDGPSSLSRFRQNCQQYRDLAESRHSTVSDLLRGLLRKEMRRELARESRKPPPPASDDGTLFSARGFGSSSVVR